MAKKETVTQEDLFEVLDMIEQLGIRYWLDGGWGVDALVGRQTREHRDVDINSMPRAPKNYGRSWKKKGMR